MNYSKIVPGDFITFQKEEGKDRYLYLFTSGIEGRGPMHCLVNLNKTTQMLCFNTKEALSGFLSKMYEEYKTSNRKIESVSSIL